MNMQDPYNRAVHQLRTRGYCTEVTTKMLLHEIEQRRPLPDSDTPIDDEWLLTVGFEKFNEHSPALNYVGQGSDGNLLPICRDYKGTWWLKFEEFLMKAPKTRADIRLMIQFMERF